MSVIELEDRRDEAKAIETIRRAVREAERLGESSTTFAADSQPFETDLRRRMLDAYETYLRLRREYYDAQG